MELRPSMPSLRHYKGDLRRDLIELELKFIFIFIFIFIYFATAAWPRSSINQRSLTLLRRAAPDPDVSTLIGSMSRFSGCDGKQHDRCLVIKDWDSEIKPRCDPID